MPVLAALHRRSPLEHVTVATYQSVSGTGQKAVDALRAQSAAVLVGEEPPAGVYPHRIAFNVLPRRLAAGRRRLHRRGAQARQRVAQDPRAARPARERDLHARAGHHLALRGRLGAHARADRPGRGARAAGRRGWHHGDRRSRPPTRTRWRSTPTARTACSSAASAATSAIRTRSRCGSWPTTCARARPRTPCEIAELLVRDRLLRSAAV